MAGHDDGKYLKKSLDDQLKENEEERLNLMNKLEEAKKKMQELEKKKKQLLQQREFEEWADRVTNGPLNGFIKQQDFDDERGLLKEKLMKVLKKIYIQYKD